MYSLRTRITLLTLCMSTQFNAFHLKNARNDFVPGDFWYGADFLTNQPYAKQKSGK